MRTMKTLTGRTGLTGLTGRTFGAGLLMLAAMLAAGLQQAEAQTNATNTAIMLRNGTSLVPTNAAGVLSNALGLESLKTTNASFLTTGTLPDARLSTNVWTTATWTNLGGEDVSGIKQLTNADVRAAVVNQLGLMEETDEGEKWTIAESLRDRSSGRAAMWIYDGELHFKNPVEMRQAMRSGIGLGASWLTNTNASGFLGALGLPAWVVSTNSSPTFTNLTVVELGLGSPGYVMADPGGKLSRLSGMSGDSNGVAAWSAGSAVMWSIPNLKSNLGLGASWLTNSNVPTPYSGAAVAGALLTADGAGGSAFSGSISISTHGGFSFGSSAADNIILRAGTTQVISAKYSDTAVFSVQRISIGESFGDNNSSIFSDRPDGWNGTIAFRRSSGTNFQAVRVYGYYTGTNDWRRLNIVANTNGVVTLKAEGSGTYASNNVLHISGLPTNNPGAGILWNSNGAVMVGD